MSESGKKERKPRTDVKTIPVELLPLDLVIVDLNEAPVTQEMVFPDLDLGTVQNRSNDARGRLCKFVRRMSLKELCLFNILPRHVDQVDELIGPRRL